MHAHRSVRRRIGVAVLAVATTLVGAPRAQASSTTTPAASTRKHKYHWGRQWGWSNAAPRRVPTAAEIVLAVARAQLGKPYVWAGAGPRVFDCSGLTQFAYHAAGIALPHNAAAQYDATRHVPAKEMRPGDLVFFGVGGVDHVGVYLGAGKMIHAPRTGEVVRIAPLMRDLVAVGRPA
jgi:cell wall-associated NlpC family hydrolase